MKNQKILWQFCCLLASSNMSTMEQSAHPSADSIATHSPSALPAATLQKQSAFPKIFLEQIRPARPSSQSSENSTTTHSPIDNSQESVTTTTPLEQELARLKEEKENSLNFIRRSVTLLTILGACGFTLTNMQRPRATRFISDALTLGSMAGAAFQGIAGCAVFGFGYYQVHKLIYNGCVLQQEFDPIKRETYRLKEIVNSQTTAINNHAAELDNLQKTISLLLQQQQELIRVANDHATKINEGIEHDEMIKKILTEQSRVINANAKIIRPKTPITTSEELFQVQTERAAIPQTINQELTSLPITHAATVSLQQKQKTNCFCCKE